MDLQMTPEDAAFRDEVRGLLSEHLSKDMRDASSLTSGVFAEFEIGRRWHRALHARGWIAPGWPTEHGGTGWTPMQRYIYDSEAGAHKDISISGQQEVCIASDSVIKFPHRHANRRVSTNTSFRICYLS